MKEIDHRAMLDAHPRLDRLGHFGQSRDAGGGCCPQGAAPVCVVATIAAQERGVAKLQGVQIKDLSSMLNAEEADRANTDFIADCPGLGTVTAPIWALIPRYVKMVDNTVSFGHKEEWLGAVWCRRQGLRCSP